MENSRNHIVIYFLSLIILISTSVETQAQNETKNSVSGIYVFGDSTVDPGNNNYIKTIFKGNFPPYGRDFENQIPTGRFTNGRLLTDFLVSYVGLKEYLPPYLNRSLGIDELITGVSFASAGSGYDPLTAIQSNLLKMSEQLDCLKELKERLEVAIGKKGTDDHIKSAAFIASAGTDDFVTNYYALPTRRLSYSISEYEQFVLQNQKQFLQGLFEEGARTIVVISLPPMGCLPLVITLKSNDPIIQRNCFESYSSIAIDYNQKLKSLLKSIPSFGSKIYYVDIYEPLLSIIQDGPKFGFEEVNIGCCETGYVEVGILCISEKFVCTDASKYVFWDSIHPTEMTYYKLFELLRPTIDKILNEI